MEQKYAVAGIEPPLEELLNDPITRLLMQRDRIGLGDVRRAVAAARSCVGTSTQDAAQELRGIEPTLELPPSLRTGSRAGSESG